MVPISMRLTTVVLGGLEKEHQDMGSLGVLTAGLDIVAQGISAHKLFCLYLEPHCRRRKQTCWGEVSRVRIMISTSQLQTSLRVTR